MSVNIQSQIAGMTVHTVLKTEHSKVGEKNPILYIHVIEIPQKYES
jgi:hypothetical protein